MANVDVFSYEIFLQIAKGLSINEIRNLCQSSFLRYCDNNPKLWSDLITDTYDLYVPNATQEDYVTLYNIYEPNLNNLQDYSPEVMEVSQNILRRFKDVEFEAWISGKPRFLFVANPYHNTIPDTEQYSFKETPLEDKMLTAHTIEGLILKIQQYIPNYLPDEIQPWIDAFTEDQIINEIIDEHTPSHNGRFIVSYPLKNII